MFDLLVSRPNLAAVVGTFAIGIASSMMIGASMTLCGAMQTIPRCLQDLHAGASMDSQARLEPIQLHVDQKAHAKRKLSKGTGECERTMSYYAQHYQDEDGEGETNIENTSNRVNNIAIPITDSHSTAMQDELHVDTCDDELPDWRALCSSHQQNSILHHNQEDKPQYQKSSTDCKPPVIVYYRRRKNNLTNAQPSLAHRYITPCPHTPKESNRKGIKKTSSKQPGRKGVNKKSKAKEEIKLKVALQFKAGQMILRKTASRIKRSLAATGKLRQTSNKHRAKALKQRKSELQREVRGKALSKMHVKGPNNKKSSLNHQIPKSSPSSANLLRSYTSQAVVSGQENGPFEKATIQDFKSSAGSSPPLLETKRKKHRPKVQGAYDVPRCRKPSFGLHKTQGHKPKMQHLEPIRNTKKRGRKKKKTLPFQMENLHNTQGHRPNLQHLEPIRNTKKRGRKKKTTFPFQMENLLRSGKFCVVSGCPEVLDIIPCSFHRDEVKALPALQSTKQALILCIQDPSKGKEIAPAEASSLASNDVSQQVDANISQLALAADLHHPLTTFNTSTQIVHYDKKREIVLFKVRKELKRVRPKVPISDENERIWPLLAQGGIPRGHDDPEYWNKERNLMKERVQDFILRMHGVQGD
ncbi:hypothetical protein L7F22_021101 [Adiantum nelumboides]|nr:hypothetical protein [Adiantum nelumboides]